MSLPPELGLDCKTNGYSILLNSFGDDSQQTQKLKEFLDCLEEERLKIDAFKRELPLCMQLLNNAVEASRHQLETYKASQGTRPVLEELIPLKQSSAELSDNASNKSEKTNWMTTAQLWSHANDGSKYKAAKMSSSDGTEQGFSITPKLSLDNKERNGGGFLPFSRERNFCTNPPELTLASVNKEIAEKKCLGPANGMSSSGKEHCTKGEKEKGMANGAETQTTTQPQRKARRCWSPDLHRRFVNALQMLGGSQVATPKQIRELMKVDGLTNDEVKSHLQKYRLHTRRPGPNPPSPATQAPQLVVLGGIWVPPEYAAAHGAIYGAHPASAHYCAPPVPQDFYPGPPHHHYHPCNKASSQTHSSPESDNREAGERSESMEEVEEEGGGKSDSGSWRGRGKEEGMVARGLLSLKDGGEDEGESHGSGITLKF